VLYSVSSASPVNIRLGWKGLPGLNTLAYYENPYITTVKSLIGLPLEQYSKHFDFFLTYKYFKQARVFSYTWLEKHRSDKHPNL